MQKRLVLQVFLTECFNLQFTNLYLGNKYNNLNKIKQDNNNNIKIKLTKLNNKEKKKNKLSK